MNIYLTLPENNENIDVVAFAFNNMVFTAFQKELYSLRDQNNYTTQLAFLCINALNYYNPLDDYNYITEREALLIMSKFTGK